MRSPDGGVVMARPGVGCRMRWFNRKVALLDLNIMPDLLDIFIWALLGDKQVQYKI